MENKTTKYAMFMVDQYGSTSIMPTTGKTLEDLYKEARKSVHNENIENAFTADEKEKNWDYYLPEVLEKGNLSKNYIYAGKNSKGQQSVFSVKDPTKLLTIDQVPGISFRFYLGELDRNPLYAKDDRGNLITSFDHRKLENKSVYYVKKM
jgi:hypothetical protein